MRAGATAPEPEPERSGGEPPAAADRPPAMPDGTTIAELAVGGAIVLIVLADVFATILVPGPVGGRLRVILAVRSLSLPLWRLAARRRRDGDARPRNGFAPVTLVLTFAAWMLLLLAGFATLIHAVGPLFRPRIEGWGDATWVAGSSLMTLGVSEFDAQGPARWLILAGALAGFSALTASVTFMLQIQAGLHQREPAVMTLVGLAGAPPSGVRILESFAALGDRDQLARFFLDWRNWAASTLHSHLSYPVLSYYRSLDAQNDWLAALEAVLDAATLVMVATDDPACGAATLMHRTGSRTAKQLRDLFKVRVGEAPGDAERAEAAIRRLRDKGYAGGDEPGAAARFLGLRADYAGDLEALASHLGANRAVLLAQDG